MARFIVLIPTLNGAATLPDTLATCCAQDHADCRIIVSDNCSNDQTADIVHTWQARDGRVEYMRPERRVSMSTHWEFMLRAILHEDAFLIVLGCDDALMPGALLYANELLNMLPETKCLAWHTNYYHYPDLSDPSMAGRMMLHLGRNVEARDARTWLRHTAMGNAHYTALPNVYHGLTHTALLRSLAQGSSQMIRSLTPDIYLSLALSCVLDKYVFLGEPLSLNVISKSSNGFSHSSARSDRSIKNQFMKENDRPFHRDLPVSDDIYMLHTECLLHVRDAGLLPGDMTIELRNLLGKAVIHTHVHYRATPLFEERQAQLEAIAERYFLQSFMKEISSALSQGNQAKLSSLIDGRWYLSDFDYVAKLDSALVANTRAAAMYAGEILRAAQTTRSRYLNSVGGLLKQPAEGNGQMPAQVLLKLYQQIVSGTAGENWINPAFLECYSNRVRSRPSAFDCSLYLKALSDQEVRTAVVAKDAAQNEEPKTACARSESRSGDVPGELPLSQSNTESRPTAVSSEVKRLAIFLSDANCGDARLVIPYQAGHNRYGWEGTFVSPGSQTVPGGAGCAWLVQRWPWILPEMLERGKAAGTRIVHDLDDLLWNIPNDNPNKYFFDDSKIKLLLQMLAHADCATVSTEVLAEELRRKGIPASVLPNCIAPERWAHLRPMRLVGKRPRIGWAGQRMVHAGDLELLREVMERLGKEVEWVFLGETPLFAESMDIHVESVPMVSIQEYPGQLAALSLDLALAPLSINRFNEAKSDIRLLHYGALGYPVVATDIVPHRQAPVRLVPNTVTAWVEAIRERISDLDAAAQEGERLREWVFANRSIDVWIDKYAMAWLGRSHGNKETVVQGDSHAAVLRMPTFSCSIIMPVLNNVALTRQALTALADVTDGCEYEVIIVDNHSTDGTREFLSSLGGDVQIIRNEENRGFAKACNQGAQVARGRYLVFLNNDTIPLKGWLNALVQEVEVHQDVGVVGSKLLYADGTVQHAGVVFSRAWLTPYHHHRRVAADLPFINQRREFQSVTAACMLVRRDLFLTVGGFDERYRNGFEDVDLCLKIKQQGWRVVYQPNSVLYHLESQTPGRKDHDVENHRLFTARWGACWWLTDEDLVAFQDGFCMEYLTPNSAQWRPLENAEEHRRWRLVADTQQAAGQRDDATVLKKLEQYSEWPADRLVLKWAASVAEAMKQPEIASAFMQRVTALDDPAAEQLAGIREALGKGHVTIASSQLDTLLKQYPMHAEGLLLKAILHMQREQYEPAEAAFSSALHEGVDRKKCLMGMGMAAMGRAYTQGAWEHFLQVLVEHPDDAEAIHWLLRAGTAQNRWHELSERLQAYVTRNPGDVATRLAFAGVLLRDEQVEAARREHDALRRVAPDHDGLTQLGQAIAGREAALAFDAASS